MEVARFNASSPGMTVPQLMHLSAHVGARRDRLAAICDPCHRDKTAAEAARAQGRKPRRRVEFGPDGWPIW